MPTETFFLKQERLTGQQRSGNVRLGGPNIALAGVGKGRRLLSEGLGQAWQGAVPAQQAAALEGQPPGAATHV